MRTLPAALVAAALLAGACSAIPMARPAGVTPLPASPPIAAPDPALAALRAADAGLPLVASRDAVGAEEAAAAEPNQAEALPLFESWGWVAESTRSFAGGAASVQETVLLLQRSAGAANAFAYFAEEAATSPMTAGLCPPAVSGLDECTLGSGGGRTIIAGRRGPEIFQLVVAGADAVHLAATQAARLAGS